ncbi:MAG TPA: 23S rRNA (pseudouridine(1915)-N(3))-methyltransferase RlmH [Candidatus Acidoferrales bacterium]|nr:23S rRNA (pseudouridine(1915)-N(3))-methyltransferase RlmH [Candidatus Acidoferrales bacterium]
MKIDIIAVDKLREAYLREGCDMYVERLNPLAPVSIIEVRSSSGPDAPVVEGEAILNRLQDDALLWALDQTGRSMSSHDLAARLASAERSGARRLVLAIGGAQGLSAAVRKRANFVWSLSELTFLHEMARLIVLEQLYRAVKINRGQPYHR